MLAAQQPGIDKMAKSAKCLGVVWDVSVLFVESIDKRLSEKPTMKEKRFKTKMAL